MILDSVRYWVTHMHVDGFRFDLASILSRDEDGRPLENPPVLWDIESDPVLAGIKLIAEAWDAAGLYQVGSFIGDNWKEWNGRFRDDVRRFVKSDNGTVGLLAQRALGSPDIFGHEEREPEQSINFVTCHDGFTLNDLVSYNEQAQRGEWRRQPGRARPRTCPGTAGSKDRPTTLRSSSCAPSDQELYCHSAHLDRYADVPDGRRDASHPAGQQQCLLPGQRDQLARLEPPRPAPRISTNSCAN